MRRTVNRSAVPCSPGLDAALRKPRRLPAGRPSLLIAVLTLMLLCQHPPAWANSSGRTGQTLRSSPTAGCGARTNGGGSCHGTSANSNIQVLLTGPTILRPGAVGIYSIALTGSTGPGGGVDIAASRGTLTPVSSSLKLQTGELTHSSPVTAPFTLSFSYAVGTAGIDTLYANGKGTLLTGEWNWAPNLIIRVGPPPAPTLLSPANNSTGISTTATLSWTGISGATWTVEVSTSSSFATPIIHTVVSSGSSYTIPADTLQNNTQYFWRVSATDSGGTSGWSTPTRSFTTSLTAVEEGPDGVPSAYALEQNYPNPFNPSTRIGFSLPASGLVDLAVYDLQGKEVAVLARGPMPPGHHVVILDASRRGIASGVYFYRLRAMPLGTPPGEASGRFTASRKLLILR